MPAPPDPKAKAKVMQLVEDGHNRLKDIAQACGYRSSASALHFMQKLVHENLVVKFNHRYYTLDQYAELQAMELKSLAPTNQKPRPIYESRWKGSKLEDLLCEARERRLQRWRDKFG